MSVTSKAPRMVNANAATASTYRSRFSPVSTRKRARPAFPRLLATNHHPGVHVRLPWTVPGVISAGVGNSVTYRRDKEVGVMPGALAGRRIAFLVAPVGAEQVELTEPWLA